MLLEMRDISKSFAGISVLRDVNVTVEAGQIRALLGHNGAGKSTLMKILGGVFAPQSGAISIDGRPVHLPNPRAASREGVAVIHQDFSLIPDLTVAENIALGRYPSGALPFFYRRRATLERSMIEAEAVGGGLPMKALVRSLGVAQQQMVEIARAVSQHGRILVMDEPTARLAPAERERLFDLMRSMARGGAGVIFITHFLSEVSTVADVLTILRNGQVVADGPVGNFTTRAIADMLVGEDAALPPVSEGSSTASRSGSAQSFFSLRNFSVAGRPPLDLDVARGEIVGIAGLIGSGRSHLARGIIGDAPSFGDVKLGGRTLSRRSPRSAMLAGIAMVPEDRLVNGLVRTSSVRDNITLSALGRSLARLGLVARRPRRALAAAMIKRFSVKPADMNRLVSQLSGGNAQKVLVARAVAAAPEVLILDQPTAGVDIGAKAELHAQIRALAAAGTAILLVSDELDELLEMTERIIVLYGGVPGEILKTSDCSRASLLAAISTPHAVAHRQALS